MIGSFQTGISGLQQFQQDLEVIGNNIANVNTTGFKGSRMDFEDALSQNLTGGGMPMQVGTGVLTSAVKTLFGQGTISNTDVSTDLAIDGNGFFVVRDPGSNLSYVTRDGSFRFNSDGYLVTNNDMRVQGYVGTGPFTSGSIVGDIRADDATARTALGVVDPTASVVKFTFDNQGQLTVRMNDTAQTIGVISQVVLQKFIDPQMLIKESKNLYSFVANAGPLAAPLQPRTSGLGSIAPGYLEMSNVDLSTEMTSLITAQRAFQANAKIVTTSDEILQDLVNLKR